jgi:hypothetical protein
MEKRENQGWMRGGLEQTHSETIRPLRIDLETEAVAFIDEARGFLAGVSSETKLKYKLPEDALPRLRKKHKEDDAEFRGQVQSSIAYATRLGVPKEEITAFRIGYLIRESHPNGSA